MTKTKAIIAVFAALLIISGLGALAVRSLPGGNVARVYVDGKQVREIPLDRDSETVIETAWGSNTITVTAGELRVTEADCPDKVCIRTGILRGGVPIVCLPHRLTVTLGAGGDADAAVG